MWKVLLVLLLRQLAAKTGELISIMSGITLFLDLLDSSTRGAKSLSAYERPINYTHTSEYQSSWHHVSFPSGNGLLSVRADVPHSCILGPCPII